MLGYSDVGTEVVDTHLAGAKVTGTNAVDASQKVIGKLATHS